MHLRILSTDFTDSEPEAFIRRMPSRAAGINWLNRANLNGICYLVTRSDFSHQINVAR
ncbi:hypothetical protein D3C79_905020 [compost metagenome]